MALATDCNECILLDGISANNCRGDLGGIFSRISLAPACTVASKTKTGSLISAITMYEVSVGVDYNWLTVQTKRNTGIVDELSDLNGIITQSVTLVISNYSDNADLETAASEQAEFLNNLKKNDELIFDVYRPELEIVKPIIEDCMKNAIPNLKVPIEVGMGVGNNWLEAH